MTGSLRDRQVRMDAEARREPGPASIALLREIARAGAKGLVFREEPRARYRSPDTGHVYNARTFWPLAGRGLINPGSMAQASIITEAGAAYLANLDGGEDA